jgi:hypothetical protein
MRTWWKGLFGNRQDCLHGSAESFQCDWTFFDVWRAWFHCFGVAMR